jgi:hypothetical protein
MKWWGFIALGTVWIAVVVGTLIVSLVSAEQAGASGAAEDPSFTRGLIAALSGAIFGLPGVFMIIAGLRRRRAA